MRVSACPNWVIAVQLAHWLHHRQQHRCLGAPGFWQCVAQSLRHVYASFDVRTGCVCVGRFLLAVTCLLRHAMLGIASVSWQQHVPAPCAARDGVLRLALPPVWAVA